MNQCVEAARQLRDLYNQQCQEGLSLDMTRGRPSSEQLDLSSELYGGTVVGDHRYKSLGGLDCRNYGGVDGLPEMKAIFAQIMDVPQSTVIVGGNSSLQLMFDTIARHIMFRSPDSEGPWFGRDITFLCPSPGYDRHFAICDAFGINMIPVPMGAFGPDMDFVEALVSKDDSIKGIWCVPRYSNPTGVTYSQEVVERLARMKTSARDFRIFWDNAYAIHSISGGLTPLASLYAECEKASSLGRVIVFSSTSKITFAGSGVAALACSDEIKKFLLSSISVQTIGPDKMNQLSHALFFRDFDGLMSHMDRHAAILKPRFDAVERVLTQHLDGLGVATWTKPTGGYFVSLDTLPGLAGKVYRMAGQAGVKLTPVGSTYPNGLDPNDTNIRIAPSMPSVREIEKAMEVLATCIKLAAYESGTRSSHLSEQSA